MVKSWNSSKQMKHAEIDQKWTKWRKWKRWNNNSTPPESFEGSWAVAALDSKSYMYKIFGWLLTACCFLWHVSPQENRTWNQVWPTKFIPTYILWKLEPLEPKKEETKNFHLCLLGEFWITILQIYSYWHWLANLHTTRHLYQCNCWVNKVNIPDTINR